MKYTIENTPIRVETITAIMPQYNGYFEENRQPAIHVSGQIENELIDCVIFANQFGDLDLPKTEAEMHELWLNSHPGRGFADRETLATIRGEGEDQNRQIEWDEDFEFPKELKRRFAEMLGAMDKRLDTLAAEHITLIKYWLSGHLPKEGVSAAIKQILAERENLNRLHDTCWRVSLSVPDFGRLPTRVRRYSYLSAEEIASVEEVERTVARIEKERSLSAEDMARIKAEERVCRAFGWDYN